MSQIRHDPDQHVSVRDPQNWGMVPNCHAGVLLGVCVCGSDGQRINLSDHLVYPVCAPAILYLSHIFQDSADLCLAGRFRFIP